MKRRKFRLLLEPGLQGVVRLAQLEQYGTDRIDGQRMLLAPELGEHVQGLFPARLPAAVLDALLGKPPIGWKLEMDGLGGSQSIAIRSDGRGVALSAMMRILEHIVPEALLAPMIYEPLNGNGTSERIQNLH